MKVILILALTGLTSVGAFFFGVRRLRFSVQSLGTALGKTLESVGATVVFLTINLVAAVVVVLSMRGLTGTFVSVYVIDDAAWLGLSLLQGLPFQWWRELSGKVGK